MKTPAQRSAISIRVEASIVAVRRGMARQYGTLLSDLRQGATVTRTSGAGVRLLHRGAETGVSVELGAVAARLLGPVGPTAPQPGDDRGQQRNQQPDERPHVDLPTPR